MGALSERRVAVVELNGHDRPGGLVVRCELHRGHPPGGHAGDVDVVAWDESLGREEVDPDRIGTAAAADPHKQRPGHEEAEHDHGEHLNHPGSSHGAISISIWTTGGMGLPEASLEGMFAGGRTVPPAPPGWPLC